MDRGGTITWYLNANDTSFMATLAKARAEAKAAGSDIDRSLSRSATNARSSMQGLGSDSDKLTGSLRNVRKDVSGLGSDSNGLKNSLTGVSGSSNTLAATLGGVALRSDGLKGSFTGLTDNSKKLNSSLGSSALRGFGVEMGNTEKGLRKVDVSFRDLGLSLRDFHKDMGRGATIFRNFQIATRGFELTALVIGATVAGGAIIELAGNVAALAGLLVAVPSAVAVAASAFATLAVGTSGIADAFKKAIKPIKGATAAQKLGERQSTITASAMKRDADLVRQLTDLNEQYNETLAELADERLRKVNEQIMLGVEAWDSIAKAATNYLDISETLAQLQLDVAAAQGNVASAVVNYGAASQQAIEATRNLYEAQGKLAQANADLDQSYSDIKDSVRNLATNLDSLKKANRNQINATRDNLKALRLDKQARGENTDEITDMIAVLDQLSNIKATDLDGPVPDLADAQQQLDDLKHAYPEIAVAGQEAATSTEKSLTKSLGNIADSMADVRRERAELMSELQSSLADAADDAAVGAQGTDPFQGLSVNARKFAEALVEVYNKFQPIKNAIQDKLFAGLDDELRSLATTSFPTIETGLGKIATSLNGMAKEAARVAKEPFFQNAIANSMDTTAKSTDILTRAIEPLAKVFTDLTNLGNPYILMLSDWVVKQTNLAAAFTGSADGQKKLTKLMDLGIAAMKQILDLFGSVGKLLFDVFETANDSGFSMIKTLTQIVDNVDKWVNTKEGQESLKALFEASSTILLALADAVGLVLRGLLGLIKAYNELDGPAKTIITDIIVFAAALSPVLTYLSSITASFRLLFNAGQEVVQASVTGFKLVRNTIAAVPEAMAGFKAGMEGIKVANDGAAGAFGRIGNAVGATRDAFSSGIGKAKEFATTLVDVGKKGATTAATMAADGAKAAAGWVAGAVKAAATWVAQFAVMIARSIVTVATMVANAVVVAAAWVAGAVATTAAWIIANAAILGIWGLIIIAIIAAVALIIANWDKIKEFFIGVFNTIKGAIEAVINWVKENWPLLLAILTGPIGIAVLLITKHWDDIKNAFAAAWEFIKGVWNQVGGFFNGIWNTITGIFNRIKDGIVSAFQNAINWIRGVPGQIWGALGNLGNMLVDSGWSLIMGFWHGIENAIWNVKSWISGALRSIRNLFPFSPAKEGPFSGAGYTDESGKALMEDFGRGITSMGDVVLGKTEDIVGSVAGVFSGLATNVGAMQAEFGLSAQSQLDANIGGAIAPSVMTPQDGNAELTGAPVVINQTNEVHSELDMEQVNRNLAWEMSKV